MNSKNLAKTSFLTCGFPFYVPCQRLFSETMLLLSLRILRVSLCHGSFSKDSACTWLYWSNNAFHKAYGDLKRVLKNPFQRLLEKMLSTTKRVMELMLQAKLHVFSTNPNTQNGTASTPHNCQSEDFIFIIMKIYNLRHGKLVRPFENLLRMALVVEFAGAINRSNAILIQPFIHTSKVSRSVPDRS